MLVRERAFSWSLSELRDAKMFSVRREYAILELLHNGNRKLETLNVGRFDLPCEVMAIKGVC